MQECWEDLANAIILQAVEDYRLARKVLRRRPEWQPALRMQRDTTRFFQSRWFARLTDMDGASLLKGLREEAID